MEFRNAELEVASEARSVAGYGAVYDVEAQLPQWRERIAKKAVQLAPDVKLLVEHDRTRLLARTKSRTLELRTDQRGLAFSSPLPDTTLGRDIREQLARGDLDGASIGFQVIRDSWKGELRTIHELMVFEISLTADPAYADAAVALRTRHDPLAAHRRRAAMYRTLIGGDRAHG
jgi:hypothetical protein